VDVEGLSTAFDRQPTLRGDLVVLRPLHADDFDAVYAVASDPLIWEQHPAHDRYQERVFRDLFRESLESGGTLVALDAGEGRVIGWSRFHGYDPAKSEIEIGWTFLARSHWGGRCNGEMKALMLRHAFQFVNRVIFVIGAQNIRSQRAVEKIGAVRAGSRHDTGDEKFIYEITAGAWPPPRSGVPAPAPPSPAPRR
jgi:RimJ/RimL family protein N-acetyltransferase